MQKVYANMDEKETSMLHEKQRKYFHIFCAYLRILRTINIYNSIVNIISTNIAIRIYSSKILKRIYLILNVP